ncbi:MFS transporter [Microbispora sp. RL4-1S]|uniref:MFS transporter n=1 Tax=Microbispora oryzae TaxID=2806554 RepID=A0A941ARZ6_9ACTN|nr:MFS transporter [Microbispora oryzae]MBP2706964.1 MFS transporter [Microbispora oryzae]
MTGSANGPANGSANGRAHRAANALRGLLSSYVLPNRAGRVIVAAVVVYATGSGLYLAGGTVFFVKGVGLSTAEVGTGLTVAGLAGFLTTVPVSMLARRFGPLQLLRMVQVWRAAWLAALAFADNVWTFTLFASLFMISQGPVLPMVQLVVGAAVGERDQTKSLGVIGSVSNVGMCLGALAAAPFLSFGDVWMLRSILLLGALCCVASAGLFGLVHVEVPAPADRPARWHSGLLPVLRDLRYLALTTVNGVLFLHTVLFGIGLPLWLVESTDAPAGLLSALITVNTVLAIALQVHFAKRVGDSRGGTRALRGAGVVLAASSLTLVASSYSRTWLTIGLLVVATILLTCGEMLQAVGGWELSYRHAPPALRTEYLSVFSLGGAAVGIAGPLLLAVVLSLHTAGMIGLAVLFLFTAGAASLVGARLARAEHHDALEPEPDGAAAA